MIRHPLGILSALLLIEGTVLYFSENPRFQKFFRFPPPIFWIYFLPMVFSSANIIPHQSALYSGIGTYVLPASLILLLISADLKAILKLGKPALGMMAVGSLGVILGAPAVLWLFKPWLSADAWSGFAALSASWTGGSANMIAVKEALGTPDAVFLPLVVVDTIVAYSWMGMLILLAGVQVAYDKWNRSDRTMIDALHQKIVASLVPASKTLRLEFLFLIILIGALGALVSSGGARWCSNLTGIPLNTGLILIASTLGILFSFTPVKKLESFGASKVGYILLYFVLTSIGARANLTSIVSAPVLILAGFVWVLIHALFLLTASRLTRIPMCLMAAASQANIGGPASAPVVAAIYEPALAPVGLLLGILGNVMGTYLGLVTSMLCKWVAS